MLLKLLNIIMGLVIGLKIVWKFLGISWRVLGNLFEIFWIFV